ncbi:hypothetical protein D3C77_735780 [compost metagenome]
MVALRRQADLRLRLPSGAAQFTMKAVRAQQPQVILVRHGPVIAERFAGLDGIAPWDLVQIQPVVNVKYHPLCPGVVQVERQ